MHAWVSLSLSHLILQVVSSAWCSAITSKKLWVSLALTPCGASLGRRLRAPHAYSSHPRLYVVLLLVPDLLIPSFVSLILLLLLLLGSLIPTYLAEVDLFPPETKLPSNSTGSCCRIGASEGLYG